MNQENFKEYDDFQFVSNDMDNKAKDLSRFTQEANEQEFTICRFLIGWSAAAIGAITAFYLQTNNLYLNPLKFTLIPLALSTCFGVLHHLSFHLSKNAVSISQIHKNV